MKRKQISIKKLTEKNLEDGLKEFILYCRVRNLSDYTIQFYEDSFKRFFKFLPENTPISALDKDTINQYILWLKNTNLNSISINTALNGIRPAIYYYAELGYVKQFTISKIKAEKKIKETYTEQEITILLKKPDIKKCDFIEYRDWCIINVLLATGMRLRTLINLKVKDIDLDNMVIKYTATKNRKQQIVPLSSTLCEVLREYIIVRNTEEDDWLFCSLYGEKLTNNATEHSLKLYNNRRGVIKSGVHLWRHTFAKIWILNNGDPFRLQKILGHKDLDTVKEYIDLFSVDLQKDFDKNNPLEIMVQNNPTKQRVHTKLKRE